MDETRIVREAYGQPAPPTPDEIARARALLGGGSGRLDFAGPAGDAADDVQVITVGPAAAPVPGRRRRFGWRAQAGVGMVAAAAAAVTGIVLLGGAPAEPDRRPAAGPGPKAARDLLLAVAERSERLPDTRGRYWYSDQITGQSYIIRVPTGPYAIVGAHDEFFQWSGARAGDGTAFYGRRLPARPLTPADEAAWRRAGSPGKFRVWSNDHFQTYMRKASLWKIDDPDPRGGGSFFLQGAGTRFTTEEVLALSADPAKLTALFLQADLLVGPKRAEVLRKLKRDLEPMTPAAKLGRVAAILQNVPISPKVRAGLLRALVQQPGVRVVGETTDPLGRRGVAVTADLPPRPSPGLPDPVITNEPEEEKGDFGSRDELIFDLQTGELLSEQTVLTEPGGKYRTQRPGFLINYWITRDDGWTDTRPKPPGDQPF
ncbi:CU044_5270 family protein [Actinomadura rudentiformis]|uniref:CU044_5270 family protein n=1 Tax=Actinomadura rudentiformis TaxID=359158 RepID=A0A6H9Z4S7_9ACTN|nr:CU044_5270 family protein [Actinomadura rudentiformis]KAB2348492.1 hypothetical protein F8566_17065 [Actinomadura rudentiformis]